MRKLALSIVGAAVLAACGQSVFDLEVGMCFDGAIDSGSTVEAMECAEPHDHEVYHLVEYTETDIYPGEESMADFAEAVCLPAFEDYVGVTYQDSEIYAAFGYPSADTWDSGDREVVCILEGEDGVPLTGSLQGAGR